MATTDSDRPDRAVYSRRRMIQGGIVVVASLAAGSGALTPVGATGERIDPEMGLSAQPTSRIRMVVTISNETDRTLTFLADELVSGEFTPGWTPPPTIAPGTQGHFQGEGDLFVVATTGTEGRVRYRIEGDGGGELYIHWDSPLIESDYDNTFHIWAPPGWEVTHSGGQGHRAELNIRLRPTALRSVPNFNPNVPAIPVTNTWNGDLPVITIGYLWNQLFDSLPGPLSDLGIQRVLDTDFGPITHADSGLCGGMVYTVMDYFNNHLLPTDLRSSPVSQDDVLFQYTRDRLWDSFDVGGGGHRYLGYSAPTYPNGDEGVLQVVGLARGRAWVTYRDEFPKIQQDIDAGRLSPMGLIQTDELKIGDNHQVLAWAYEKSGQVVTLHIYDPNAGQRDVTFVFDLTDTTGEVHIDRSFGSKRIWCFFRTDDYQPAMPPLGRRSTSVKEMVRATTAQTEPYSVRDAMRGRNTGGSVTAWLRQV